MILLPTDIETIPSQDQRVKDDIAANIKPPGNISKQETIDKWRAEKGQEAIDKAWRKTALDATKGEILCIGIGLNDDAPECFGRTLAEPESKVLIELNDFVSQSISASKRPLWIGHNILGFDLRFIWLRMVINQIKPKFTIPYKAKPWDEEVFDTMVEWAGLGSNTLASKSLDAVSQALGYEGKGDIDGSKIWDAVLDGRYDDIFEYCKDDVTKARNIYKRMTFTNF